jgi:hypothetical protein
LPCTVASAPSTLSRGCYPISGAQFDGLPQAACFGDEFQNATNYPLARVTHIGTGYVRYLKTHGHSTMAVASGSTAVSTIFDVPVDVETGASALVVVANGIASVPVAVTIQ